MDFSHKCWKSQLKTNTNTYKHSFYLNEFSVLLPQLCKQVWVCVHICVFAECCLHLQA